MNLIFEPANDGQHKYKVKINGKTIKFGAIDYQHYQDRTPLKLYSHLDHLDPVRRAHYRKRHEKILNKQGIPAYTVPYSPAWFSYYYLW
jgi:hypothetical protein